MRSVLVAACLVVLAGCGGSGGGGGGGEAEPAESPQLLEAAYEACLPVIQSGLEGGSMDDEAEAEDFLRLADGGRTLVLANAPQGGDVSALLTIPAVVCILEESKAPVSVTADMEQTRAMDGRREASWDEASVEWSYHPDDGVSAVFTANE